MERQITITLPGTAFARIQIKKSDQMLVVPKETAKLKLLAKDKGYKPSFLVRAAIAEKLGIVAEERLPAGYALGLIEGYRPVAAQQLLWDTRRGQFAMDHPDWTPEKLDHETGLVTARPDPLANHNCGGAVDVILLTDDGTPVDMGTPYISDCNPSDWTSKFQMLSPEITPEQAANRKILRDAMEAQYFTWFPREWWHFCWGDRMWAVYTDRRECFFGPVDPEKHIEAKS